MSCIIRSSTRVLVKSLGLLGLASVAFFVERESVQATQHDVLSYRVVKNWVQRPAGDKFAIAGVAVDAKSIVYAYARDTDEKAGAGGTGSIRMFDRDGKYLG